MEGCFVYILSGWEGSAADSRVLNDVLSKDFIIPEGKYYLADAGTLLILFITDEIGYSLSTQFLTPYRDIRYHLKELASLPDARPTNYKELWNLRHSMLRNIIERSFGIIKQKYQVLKIGLQHTLKTQISLFPACALISNYINDHEKEDWMNSSENRDDDRDDDDNEIDLQEGSSLFIDKTEDSRVAALL